MDSDGGPVTIDAVMQAERAHLRARGDERPLRALCISGGGIRSATFGWGALQGLAQHGLLEQFDYLSTVSGGGFIGGWLTAWIQRAGGLDKMQARLKPNAEIPADEPNPIEHLRAYNNYLTPRLGVMSADTWTVAAIMLRNIVLNWLVFIPLLLAVLMLPRLLLELCRAPQTSAGEAPLLLVFGAFALLFICYWNMLRYLPGVGGRKHTVGGFLLWAFGPLVLAAVLFTVGAGIYDFSLDVAVVMSVSVAVAAWVLYAATGGRAAWRGQHGRDLLALLGGVTVLGAAVGVAVRGLDLAAGADPNWMLLTAFGPPLFLAGFGLAGVLFAGVSSHALGTQDREWMARASAYVMMFVAVWLAIFVVGCYAPQGVMSLPWGRWLALATGGVAAWASAGLGFRASPGPEVPAAAGGPKWGLVLKIAPPVFLLLLAVGLTAFTDWLLGHVGATAFGWSDHQAVLLHTTWGRLLLCTGGFAAIGWMMARFVNINIFSVQGMYRDRLIRAYLGASNPSRNAQPFTGFAATDDLEMGQLDPRLRPFHVINQTLNLVSGERLAWQQRKAESFTASALYCGASEERLGYRPAAGYGGQGGMTLGTAVGISGAAASPSMGYHSSPMVGFIMTLFNVRLGAWLGNPGIAGAKTWQHAGPRSAVRSLAREALGLTNDRGSYIYLSDGGHFENLALYEMVRRRCGSIMVLDGGQDADFTYEDLGNALRKIRIDFRIPIKFDPESLAALRARRQRWAVATIHYSAVTPGAADGELIYLKPMLLGTEPPDVTAYAKAHPSFPHQSTADQWFDESQTESYRMLGIGTVAEMCEGWSGGSLSDLAAYLVGTGPARAKAAAEPAG